MAVALSVLLGQKGVGAPVLPAVRRLIVGTEVAKAINFFVVVMLDSVLSAF